MKPIGHKILMRCLVQSSWQAAWGLHQASGSGVPYLIQFTCRMSPGTAHVHVIQFTWYR